ncbi:MAG TPA: helix-turn-helix transcriptional regulator [Actinophytocola sp.]|uniref:helix-turn-helix domain-containing protein n=1 Tax=Actinophytocola sp. TaxID=1872138 RepID=UPI002DDD5719|nr:helix-turn-helix transcriptional regulator [Actinophytocola sp.]HEV2783475.1 helix-turn-helix transcriptional regulator [Actinophytocola sp.]
MVGRLAASFLVGQALRENRERAGLSQQAAGRVIACTQTKINYLESGRNAQKPYEVIRLLREYGTDERQIKRVVALARMAERSSREARGTDAVPTWSRIFVDLERIAEEEFCYQPLVLPGQLQTREYATALLAGDLRVPPAQVERAVRTTMARQRLRGEPPLRFQAVIEEQVLDRIVGGPSVMRAQLQHLRRMMRLDTVDLRLMPPDVPVHPGLYGSFQLLTFEMASSVCYLEFLNGSSYLQDRDDVAIYHLAADRLRADALSPAESELIISRRIAELE